MSAPLSVRKNNYFENRKSNKVKTPIGICNFLGDILKPVIDLYTDKKGGFIIIDPACGDCRLLKPFKKEYKLVGIDVKKSRGINNVLDTFIKSDFIKDHPGNFDKNDIALVIFNPPFNNTIMTGRKLLPEVFIKRVFELWGDKTPVCMFAPMGFRLNQRVFSKRWRSFRDDYKAEITSIVSLPLDVFDNVEFHSEILIWNIKGLKAHYWLSEEYIK